MTDLALVGGIERPLRLKAKIRVIPTFRAYYSDRGIYPDKRLGLSNLMYKGVLFFEIES